ncbi:hypothetical protein ACHAWO_003038 [Cyclotella atomus]|uniref:Uncharacterized protein n=1 Tax=Cyclotella atomus TaxID=382360 RepID=A0ABD3NLS7_9STRA
MAINRHVRPLITIFGAIAFASPFIFKLDRLPSPTDDRPITRRLDIAIDDSDPLATATLSVIAKQNPPPAVNSDDHKRVTAILSETRDLIAQAKTLLEENGGENAHEMVNMATAKFREAKEHIRNKRAVAAAPAEEKTNLRPEERKEMEEEGTKIVDDVDRAMDVSRNMYETFISFPECIGRLFEDCLELINADLTNLGMSTVEVVVHEKRNVNQDGYNKVVIVTNEEANRVTGRTGDGIVSYPFSWDDRSLGTRILGVDGKWNCREMTPEDCCDSIKESTKNPDTRGNYLECHVFVPFGGVGNARRNDRVFINLSPDGRVHEAPLVQ